MRTYAAVTAVLFALLTAIHVWRMFVERHLATEPWFIAVTLLSACLTVWAIRLAARPPRP